MPPKAAPKAPPPLVNPRRSAHASIRGYLYQACLSAQRWLELGDDEILICEGDEDIDRLVRGGDDRIGGVSGVSEQAKDYTSKFGKDAVRDVLAGFAVTYHAVRERGEHRRFRLITTAAQPASGSSATADLIDRWALAHECDAVVEGARVLLDESAAAGKHKGAAEAAVWLDGAPNRWRDFVAGVEWIFGQPDIAGMRQQIARSLDGRPDTAGLAAASLADRLIMAVLDASSSADVGTRTLDTGRLAQFIATARADLATWVSSPKAQRLRTILDEASDLRAVLHDGIQPRKIEADASPAKFLVAGYEVVPFDDSLRQEELAVLTELCNDGAACAVQVFVGEGGSGKTRLMVEWCRRLRENGWHAGFLADRATADDAKVLFDGIAPRLVVMDYAETRLDLVCALLDRAARHASGPLLRFVLLARRADAGSWWDALTQDDAIEDLVVRWPVRKISPIDVDADDEASDALTRQRVFRRAADAFAHVRGVAWVTTVEAPDLSDKLYGRALYVHMEALLAADGRPPGPAGDVLARVLRHEREFWLKAMRERGLLEAKLQERPTRYLDEAMAAFTLLGGIRDRTRAVAVHNAVVTTARPADHADAHLDILRSLHGGGDSDGALWIRPLEPDVLGEQLVEETLQVDLGLLDRIMDVVATAEPDVETPDTTAAARALTVLHRLTRRTGRGDGWLKRALAGRLTQLAGTACAVTIAEGDPLGFVLADELRACPSIEALSVLMKMCHEVQNQHSVVLREVALAATTLAADRIRPYASGNEAVFAGVLDTLGVRLGDVGRLEEALVAAEEAKEYYKRLASVQPDDYLADFARSLSNLSNRLSKLGRPEEALAAEEEATAIRRKLTELQREAFLPDLATSLINLGHQLRDVGRSEEGLAAAKEAVGYYQQLAHSRPETFLPALAHSLVNLGSLLGEAGRRPEALVATEEATRYYKQLAKLRPDVYLPHLARSLSNLGTQLGDMGRPFDAVAPAEESTAVRRQLSKLRPDAFLADLARSLRNLAIRLYGVGRFEDALAAAEEATAYYQQLATARPEAFLPDLAASLSNLGVALAVVGRREDALEVETQATGYYRQLAKTRPDAFLPDLAISVNNLSVRLSEVGRRDDALLAAEEAVSLRQELASARPDAFLPDLAISLHVYGNRLDESARPGEAFDAYGAAIVALSSHFLELPQAHMLYMRYMTRDYLLSAVKLARAIDTSLLQPILNVLRMFDG